MIRTARRIGLIVVALLVVFAYGELRANMPPKELKLEGNVTIDIDGQEPIDGTPGTVGHVPYKAMHTAITGEEGARAIVFRVHAAGEPVRYLEEGDGAKK